MPNKPWQDCPDEQCEQCQDLRKLFATAIREAVEEEREACAVLAIETGGNHMIDSKEPVINPQQRAMYRYGWEAGSMAIAIIIRSRGDQTNKADEGGKRE